MVKVFLAEDEFTIREGIKKRIAWEENGFQFVGEADMARRPIPRFGKKSPIF